MKLERILRPGMRGPDVKHWQRVMRVHASGFFCTATKEATVRFQEQVGLIRHVVPGLVGPRTWEMGERCRAKTDPMLQAVREYNSESPPGS